MLITSLQHGKMKIIFIFNYLIPPCVFMCFSFFGNIFIVIISYGKVHSFTVHSLGTLNIFTKLY